MLFVFGRQCLLAVPISTLNGERTNQVWMFSRIHDLNGIQFEVEELVD